MRSSCFRLLSPTIPAQQGLPTNLTPPNSTEPLWLLAPVKPLHQAKSRLSITLSAQEREEIALQMLDHLLQVAGASPVLAGALVVSRDATVLQHAARAGAFPLLEEGEGLNSALLQAQQAALARGASAILVLPADLPLITGADIEVLHQAAYAPDLNGRCAVIAPSPDGGTNALLLRPPGGIAFAFGPNSSARHQQLAAQAQIPMRLVSTPTLRLDVDRPQDLAHWQRMGRGEPT